MTGYLKVVPIRLQGPTWQTDPKKLIAEYERRAKENINIPPWMFANTPQGRANFDIIFTHCVLNIWRLRIDRKSRRVDTRFKSGNQKHLFLGHIPRHWVSNIFGGGNTDWHQFFVNPREIYLEFKKDLAEQDIKAAGLGLAQEKNMIDLLQYSARVGCGRTEWIPFLEKHRLRGGMRTHYQSHASPLRVFLHNFSWAFHKPTWETDLHFSDFVGFLNENAESRAGILADHLLMEEYGLVRKEGVYVAIDKRVLPGAARTKMVQGQGFEHFTDFQQGTGIRSIMGIIKETGGTWDGFLFWRYPKGFDPLNPHHIHRWDFYDVGSGRFPTLVDKANALLHVAAETRMRISQMHWKLTPKILAERNLPDVLEEGKTVRDIFSAYFADQIDGGLLRPEVPFVGNRAELFDGTTLTFPRDLSGCFARQESREHLVIYRMPQEAGLAEVRQGAGRRTRRIVSGGDGGIQVVRKRITTSLGEPEPVYAVYLEGPAALHPYDTSIFPDLSVMDPLAEDLIGWKPGFSPLWLTVQEQRQVCNLYDELGFAKVQWYLDNRGIMSRQGFRPAKK